MCETMLSMEAFGVKRQGHCLEKIFIIHFVESGQEEQSVSNIKAGVQPWATIVSIQLDVVEQRGIWYSFFQ